MRTTFLDPGEEADVATAEALQAWGAYDRDDPFPLFREVLASAPVHPVTLADGHDAWLVVGYDEARVALNHPASRRTCTRPSPRATAWWPKASLGRPSPVTCSASIRRTTHAFAGWSPRPSPRGASRSSASSVQRTVDDLLDAIAAAGPDARVDLIAAFAFPLPFTVICELLGVPEPDRASLGRGLTAMLVPTTTPEEYARAKEASDAVVGMLEDLVATKQAAPRRRPRQRVDHRARR